MNHAVTDSVAVLVAAKWAAQHWLITLNERHVRAHAGAVPPAFKDTITPETYNKSVEYTLAKLQFEKAQLPAEALVLLVVPFIGVLPWAYHLFANSLGTSA